MQKINLIRIARIKGDTRLVGLLHTFPVPSLYDYWYAQVPLSFSTCAAIQTSVHPPHHFLFQLRVSCTRVNIVSCRFARTS